VQHGIGHLVSASNDMTSVTRNNYVKKFFTTIPVTKVATPSVKPIAPLKTAIPTARLMPIKSD